MYSIVHPADWRTYWLGGQRQSVIADAGQTNNRFALSHSTIKPGGGAFEHSHSREAEAFFVLAGRIRYTLEGQSFVLEKGGFLHAEPGLKYSFEVLGPETAEVLILYAPAGLERFIAEAGVVEADGYQRSIDEAGRVFAAAPAYGVSYTALDKS
jgi:quercetin dioxygenase-like cupin family protein